MLPESLAIFAPNANSYRRFRPGFFVPIAPNWGPNHRQVALRIPTSDDANVRRRLYDDFNIEIGAGLGPLKGKIWRVGLMGHGAREENIEILAKALKALI